MSLVTSTNKTIKCKNILYNDDKGTTDDVNLTDVIDNYSELEIVYGADNIFDSVRIHEVKENINFDLTIIYVSPHADPNHYIYSTTCSLSKNKINQLRSMNSYITSNNVLSFGTNKYVKIFKVIGYK